MANEKPANSGTDARPSPENEPFGTPTSEPTNIRGGWEFSNGQTKSGSDLTRNNEGGESGKKSGNEKKN